MSIESEGVRKEMFMTAGVITTSSWVINSNGQVRQQMDKMDNNPRLSNVDTSRHQQTYDFSKMCTMLKLESPLEDGSKYSRGMKEMMKNMQHSSSIGPNKTTARGGKTRYYWSARMEQVNG